MTLAGKRLIGAAKEARAIARGDRTPASLMVPPDVDVKSIRNCLRLSQETFARQYGFSLGQIRDWEQNRCRPIGALRAYLLIIQQNPEMVATAVQQFAAEALESSVGESERIAL